MEQRHLLQEAAAVSTGLQDVAEGHNTEAAEALTGPVAAAEQPLTSEHAQLEALMEKEVRLQRREADLAFAWSGAFLLSVFLVSLRVSSDVPSYEAFMKLLFGLLLATMICLGVHLRRRSHRRKRTLTHALGQNHDLRQLSPLIQATRVDNTAVRNMAKQALIDLLPTLKASDSELLSDADRAHLLRLLGISPSDIGYRDLTELYSRLAYPREVQLRLSILKGLEQVGGAKELMVVERLSRGLSHPMSPAKIPDEVRNAAAECLPFLQQRADEQRDGAQLLRASSVRSTPHEALLRPALSPPGAPPEQLLRSAETDL